MDPAAPAGPVIGTPIDFGTGARRQQLPAQHGQPIVNTEKCRAGACPQPRAGWSFGRGLPSGVSPFSSSQVVFARPWRFQRIRESRKRRGRPKFRTWSVPAPAGLSDRYENEWIPSRRRVPAFRRSKAGPVPRYGAGIQGKGKTAIQYARTRRSTIFITQCGLRRAMSFLDQPLSPKRIYRMSEAPWKMNDR